MEQRAYDNKGYVTLVAVMFIGMVVLGISVAMVTWGIKALKTSSDLEAMEQAKALADACAEEGLEQIYIDENYTGTQTLTLDTGICDLIVTNLGGGA